MQHNPMTRSQRIFAMTIALAIPFISLQASAEDDIRLVLQITIDGMRQDLTERYSENFGKGGFNYLLKEGVVYRNAHYQHANTETIVGHATLATGAYPADHGMTGRAEGGVALETENFGDLLVPIENLAVLSDSHQGIGSSSE